MLSPKNPPLSNILVDSCMLRFDEEKFSELFTRYRFIPAAELTSFAEEFLTKYFELAVEKHSWSNHGNYHRSNEETEEALIAFENIDNAWLGHAIYFYHRLTAKRAFCYEYDPGNGEIMTLAAGEDELIKANHPLAVKVIGSLIRIGMDISSMEIDSIIKTLPFTREVRMDWRAIVRRESLNNFVSISERC